MNSTAPLMAIAYGVVTVAVIAKGRGTAMPAFAARLSADEIACVAACVSESVRSSP